MDKKTDDAAKMTVTRAMYAKRLGRACVRESTSDR